MIIRALTLRHGRHALPRSLRPLFNTRTVTSNAPEQPPSASTSIASLLPPKSPLKPEDIRDPNHPVALEYLFNQHGRSRTDHMGVLPGKTYKPHEQLANPEGPGEVTLELLLASQAHIGHATSLWNPANARYIHGIRGEHDPIHIISLDVTAAYLRRASAVVRLVAERGGLILFVGTRSGQARCVARAAQLAKGCHLFTKWIPGSITNGQQILGRCRKKVVDEFDREVLGFQDQLKPQAALKPDLVVCLNPLENYILLHECGAHNIPTIGIIDTDANPTWVTYPIPANDDSLRCVQLIAGVLGRAGQEGQQARLTAAKEGRITYEFDHRLQRPTRGQAEKEEEVIEAELQARQQQAVEGRQIVHDDLSVFGEKDAQTKSENSDVEGEEGPGDVISELAAEAEANRSRRQRS